MTAERFRAVWRPLHIQSGPLRKANFNSTMIISALLASAINAHFLFTHSIRMLQFSDGVSVDVDQADYDEETGGQRHQQHHAIEI